jgi:putative ABC transport system permease protein
MPWYSRWGNVFRSEQLSNEIDDELQHHLAQSVDDLVASGMSETEAWRTARRRLGNYSVQKEGTRDMDVSAWLDSVRADLVYAIRQWKASPGFAAVAILSLALGIGANTAIFEFVNAIRIRPLPVKDPSQLVALDFEKPDMREGNWFNNTAVATYPEWKQIQESQEAFSGMLAWVPAHFNLARGGEPRFADGLLVSGSYFPVLGVDAMLGRALNRQDDNATCSPAAVISYPWWQAEYGRAPDILSRTIALGGLSVPIVGVMPASFFGAEVGRRFDIALPLCMDATLARDHKGRIAMKDGWWISIIGRLKPDWTREQAVAHLHTISPAVMQATVPTSYTPDLVKSYLANRLTALNASNGISPLRETYGQPLWLLMAATGLIVLIACANLANLLLARATAREPEIAVRLAVGASRGRLVRQLLAESLLLAVAGTLVGAVLARVLSGGLITFISPSRSPLFIDVHTDVRVLLYSAALAVLTCVLFGLAPALRASFLSPSTAMRGGGRSMTAGRDRFTMRRVLVVTQVALSLVLLFGALLFTGSLRNLMSMDPGFDSGGVMLVSIGLEKARYPEERRMPVYHQIRDRFKELPGVVSVARAFVTPISGAFWRTTIGPDDARAQASGKFADLNGVTPGYFQAMRTRLIAGRDFDDHDRVGSPKVAIVNESFARKYFGGKNPIGRTFHLAADAGEAEQVTQIVGLVENAKYGAMREEFSPIAYFPIEQDEHPGDQATFLVRIGGSPGRFTIGAKSAASAVNPLIGIAFLPLSEQVRDSLLRESLMATLSGGFGLLAVSLAALGLYGVIAYMIARRANEIGIRIALGADRGQVVRLVLREAAVLLLIGTAAGIPFALWAGKTATTLLFGLTPRDAASLLGAAVLLGMIGLIASYVPARRAGALDPAEALRNA